MGWGWLLAVVLTLPAFVASGAELRIGLSADVTTMDPHFVAAQPNLTAQLHVFDTLVRNDERTLAHEFRPQ